MSNAVAAEVKQSVAEPKRLAFFERYLTLWVFLRMVVGMVFEKASLKARKAEAAFRVVAGVLLVGVGFYLFARF